MIPSIVFRLGVGLFVIVAPSILFILFWRGLMALRDDQLIERALEEPASPESGSSPTLTPLSTAHRALLSPIPEDQSISCPSCGTPNATSYRYCRGCLARLGDQ